ncbi:MAG: hypothetical protein PHI98_02440 [Eubacteriales bacterium]|nr:hypothetical protein [Eubacteriales bacterium]
MTQVTHHSRGGWQQDEIDLLFHAVRNATEEGKPLRNVFSDVGQRLQRKPNSIRNYYYARVRETPELAVRQTPFRAFTDDELHSLLREVLMGRGNGESVRACVTRLAGGDRSAMLRYQNKYRSILKNRPELLMEAARELQAEGRPCPEDVIAYRRYGQPPKEDTADHLVALSRYLEEPSIAEIVNALCRLAGQWEAATAALRERSEAEESTGTLFTKWTDARREADRLRVEVDLLKMALEDAREGKTSSFDSELDGDY